jgi:hypothetical protein
MVDLIAEYQQYQEADIDDEYYEDEDGGFTDAGTRGAETGPDDGSYGP